MITPLKLARQRRGWSQRQAAERLAITSSHMNRIENNTAKASTPVARRVVALFTELTRDQVLFPEEYVEVVDRAPVASAALARAEAT
jgi:transcriptional regulator with XRE-family HTH domain